MNLTPYTAERQALHQKIIDAVFAQKTAKAAPNACASNEPPYLLIIGGAPGAGKTTLTKWMKKQKLFTQPYVTIDKDIFEPLPEYNAIFAANGRPHPEKSPELVAEYYYLRQRILEEAITKNISVFVEDHLDCKLHFGQKNCDKDLMKTAKTHGYKTLLAAATITPYDYFAMWKKSGYKAEHGPYVLGIHKYLSENWKDIRSLFDDALLFQRNTNHGAYHDGHYYLTLISTFQKQPKKEKIYGDRKFERFKLWEDVDINGTSLATAFVRGKNEKDPDYERRMGGPGDGIPGESESPGFAEKLTRAARRRTIE